MLKNKLNTLFVLFALLLLYTGITFGQAAVDIPFIVSDNAGGFRELRIGLDLAATTGIDPALGESDLPPFPPAGVFETRWSLQPFGVGNLSTYWDYRAPGSPPAFPFSGMITHRLLWQYSEFATQISFTYNLPPEATLLITQNSSNPSWSTGILTGSGTYTLLDPDNEFTAARVFITYTNIGPVVPAPIFSISPASLNFGNVAVGGNAVLPATVTNTGNAALEISGLASSDPQYTFSPSVFPITLAPGASQIFNVTFAPTATGIQPATLTFTHNAAGSPTAYSVTGNGAVAGPTFSVTPASLNFGNVGVGSTVTLNLTVNNDGLTNPLTISSAVAAPSQYTVSPASAVIAPNSSQVFAVSFTPTAGGLLPGTVTFTHDAPGSPSVVNVNGNGIATFGLVFASDTLYLQEDSVYTETMQLKSLTATAQAIQFRLLFNKDVDDQTVLTFINIEKGTDVAGSNWSLHYNVFRGPLTSNGASVDSVYVLLYDLNQGGGLAPGDYNDLFRVKYRVADLPALQDSVKSSIRITEAVGSTFQGFPINITPSLDELTIYVKNRVASYGDVNGDGVIDILDLILVVDHIIGRDSLQGDRFTRADIAPWTPGAPAPLPDGLVNVLDLAVIQNIILTGFFPSGVAVNKPIASTIQSDDQLGKFTSGTAKAILYITNQGIEFHLNSEQAIRGAQLEFGRIDGNSSSMNIDTRLGGGYHLQTNDYLRTLMYDVLGEAVVPAGVNYVANMPFHLDNPQAVTLEKIILVNTNRQKIGHIQVEIIYTNPTVPMDYALFQNYPNPFNPTTTVEFQVPQTAEVTLKIYNTLGQEVRTLFSGQLDGGRYKAEWDGLNDAGIQMSSGTYIYRMISGEFVQSKKMVLVK